MDTWRCSRSACSSRSSSRCHCSAGLVARCAGSTSSKASMRNDARPSASRGVSPPAQSRVAAALSLARAWARSQGRRYGSATAASMSDSCALSLAWRSVKRPSACSRPCSWPCARRLAWTRSAASASNGQRNCCSCSSMPCSCACAAGCSVASDHRTCASCNCNSTSCTCHGGAGLVWAVPAGAADGAEAADAADAVDAVDAADAAGAATGAADGGRTASARRCSSSRPDASRRSCNCAPSICSNLITAWRCVRCRLSSSRRNLRQPSSGAWPCGCACSSASSIQPCSCRRGGCARGCSKFSARSADKRPPDGCSGSHGGR